MNTQRRIKMNIKKSIIDDAIKQITNAISSVHTYPEQYKSIYKRAGSKDNFKGPELFMDEVEPALKYSKNYMRKAIIILKKLKDYDK